MQAIVQTKQAKSQQRSENVHRKCVRTLERSARRTTDEKKFDVHKQTKSIFTMRKANVLHKYETQDKGWKNYFKK